MKKLTIDLAITTSHCAIRSEQAESADLNQTLLCRHLINHLLDRPQSAHRLSNMDRRNQICPLFT
ncbi:hypothetical protein SK128_017386, partial [Halocaridina rubra]